MPRAWESAAAAARFAGRARRRRVLVHADGRVALVLPPLSCRAREVEARVREIVEQDRGSS